MAASTHLQQVHDFMLQQRLPDIAWFSIRNRTPYIAWRTSFLNRIDHTLCLLKHTYADSNIQLPDNADFLLDAGDNPQLNSIEPYCMYSSWPDSHIIAIPSFPKFHEGHDCTIDLDLDIFAKKCQEECNIPFDDREDTMFWIGGTTPYRIETVTKMAKASNCDFRLGYNRDSLVPLLKQNKYKYLMDLQGIGWSMRLMWLFWLGAVVFVLDRDAHEYWFRDNFKPWVHYVPVSHDGEDFQEVYNKIRNMPDKGKHIADACRARAQQVLTESHARSRMADVINGIFTRYGSLDK